MMKETRTMGYTGARQHAFGADNNENSDSQQSPLATR